MNKTDLIQKIKQLEGISQDERAYLINLVNTKKKYGLVWEDKPEDVEEQLRESLPVLKEVKERRILASELIKTKSTKTNSELFENENETNHPNQKNHSSDTPNHILIEGDNLHALTALTFTHEGKIDVIYIDPPYNTGNKDFKYNDSFVDREDSYRHSKWLSFMDKRLRIAKRLLSEKGVIFISIDDNEQAQLKLLCDEIFNENNCFGEFAWLTRTGSMDSVSNFSKDHEYIFIYSKTLSSLKGIERSFSRYSNKDNDERGPWIADNLSASKPGGNTFYAVVDPNTKNEYWPPKGRYWPYNPDTMEIKIQEGRILFPTSSNGSPLIKRFKNEAKFNTLPVSSWIISENTPNAKRKNNTIYATFNTSGTKELQEILGDKLFNHPKPSILIKQLINQNAQENSVILDFFAGSGTTLHATMQLNAEDGGNRQCILITNNENNICEEVTYERNKRVIEGYSNAKGVAVEGLTNNNLRYYKSEFVNRDPSVKNKKELTQMATELLCIKEDIYSEQKTIGEYKLNGTYVKCFQQDNLYLLVIYDEEAIEQIVEVIQNAVNKQKSRNLHFKIYVFSNGQYPYTEEFEEVLPYITLCALPDAIYKAYQNVLPKRHRKTIPELEEETAEEVGQALDKTPDLFNQS